MAKRYKLGNGTTVRRARRGVPSICAPNRREACRALGFMHATDRGAQMELARLLARGRAAAQLGAVPGLIKMDKFVRRVGLYRSPERDTDPLPPNVRAMLQAYADGVTQGMNARGGPLIFRLRGHKPAAWRVTDCILLFRMIALVQLAALQIGLERGLLGLIRRGVPANLLVELYGSHMDNADYDLLATVQTIDRDYSSDASRGLGGMFAASNAWAVSGDRTATRTPIIANDPHMDIQRLPALWYEAEIHTPGHSVVGATAPGLPAIIFGRSDQLGWGVTYSAGDTIDYYVEQCKDGKRRQGDDWVAFDERVEEVLIKGADPVKFTVYSSDNGLLEGDPYVEGRYLSMKWVGEPGRFHSSIAAFLDLEETPTVDRARQLAADIHFPSVSIVFADTQGNIGQQLAGAYPKRCQGWSGLYPVPGWDKAFQWQGLVDATDLPGVTNPSCGFVATANHYQSANGGADVINGAMPPYRHDRICERLSAVDEWNVAEVQRLQYDFYSPHAAALLPLFLPHIVNEDDQTLLSSWPHTFGAESRAALLFENIYRSALMVVFGDGGIGRDYLGFLLRRTTFLMTTAHHFDRILQDPSSAWFEDRDYDVCFKQAVREGSSLKRGLWGSHNQVLFKNELLGDLLPSIFRIDRSVNRGPISVPGHWSTVHQAVRINNRGIESFVGPSYRYVSDMGSEQVWTNLPGGVTEIPLRRAYTSDLDDWRYGDYKRLRVSRKE